MDYESIKNQFRHFKGHQFRPYQEKAARRIAESTKFIPVLTAPTGFGKSLANICAGVASGTFTYLVHSKQLQKQLVNWFPEIPMIKGRSNYLCPWTGATAEFCTHTKESPCPELRDDNCPYNIAKQRVLDSPYRLLNYAYFLAECNHVGRFSGSNLVICDEGDLLENILTNYVKLTIPAYIVKAFHIQPPELVTTTSSRFMDAWQMWCRHVEDTLVPELEARNAIIAAAGNDVDDEVKLAMKRKKQLANILFQLSIFKENMDDQWLFQEQQTRRGKQYVFQPIWIPKTLSTMYFFKHGKRFSLSSATFPPKIILGKLLGQSPDSFDYLPEVPSMFPPENRPVKFQVVGDITRAQEEANFSALCRGIIDILAKHLHDKGVIHCVSHQLRDKILGAIDVPRMITHELDNREEIIAKFKLSKDNLVLLSPSVERGVDLPDDQCRFIVWVKAPYAYLGDKIVNARVYGKDRSIGQLWYASKCAQDIVQGTGRGMRHKDDHCVTYILDSKIKELVVGKEGVAGKPWLFPKYWLESLKF